MATFIKSGFWEKTCKPCNGYKGWLNLDELIGTSGTSGTSGLSGDLYRSSSTTELTLGVDGTIFISPGLAYTSAQDIIISYDVTNHEHAYIVSYNYLTGELVFAGVHDVQGSGTYSSWDINLAGASGGDGSNGTSGSSGTTGSSGSSGTRGTSGTSGSNGTSGTSGSTGSSGTSGTSGTRGTSGTSGITGSNGTSGTSGVSPVFPAPLVYGVYSQTANSAIVTATTTESTLIGAGVGTLIVPLNTFLIGDSFRANIGGVLSIGNNETIRIRIKGGVPGVGVVTLADSGVQTISDVNNDSWRLEVNFTVRQLGTFGVASIVSLGHFHYAKTSNGNLEGFSFNTVNNSTFDTTLPNTLNLTVQFGSTSSNNSIYSDLFVLNKIY